MGEPDWAKVLSVLYAEENSVYREIQGEISESHDLVTKSGLATDNVEGALAYLRDQGLVETEFAGHEVSEFGGEVQSSHIGYELTQKGFDVAHEREMNIRQEKHDRVISAFTVVLGAAALVQARVALDTLPYPQSVLISGFMIFVMIAMLIVLRGHVEFLTG